MTTSPIIVLPPNEAEKINTAVAAMRQRLRDHGLNPQIKLVTGIVLLLAVLPATHKKDIQQKLKERFSWVVKEETINTWLGYIRKHEKAVGWHLPLARKGHPGENRYYAIPVEGLAPVIEEEQLHQHLDGILCYQLTCISNQAVMARTRRQLAKTAPPALANTLLREAKYAEQEQEREKDKLEDMQEIVRQIKKGKM